MTPLSLHRLIARAGLSAASIFAWIFAFQMYLSKTESFAAAFVQVSFLYMISQVVICLLTPYAARAVRDGVRRLMMFAMACAASAFVFFAATIAGYFGDYSMYALVCYAILLGVYRAMYWVPYSLELSSNSHATKFTLILSDFLIAAIPLLSTLLLIDTYGIVVFLALSASVLCISLFPLLYARDTYERFSWSYSDTFGHLIEPRYSPIVFDAFSEGVQGASVYFIWPILVFLIADQSYVVFGAIITLSMMFAIPMRFFVRSFSESTGTQPSLPTKLIVIASVWIFRALSATPLAIIVVDAYAATSRNSRPFEFDLPIEHAADYGAFVDEFTALKELAMALGRIGIVSLVAAFALVYPLAVALLMALLVSGIFALLASYKRHQSEKFAY